MANAVLSQEYIDERVKAKLLFKQGCIQDSFEHIETDLLKKSKDKTQTDDAAWFEVLDALVLHARLR